jgi:hypothetical protein
MDGVPTLCTALVTGLMSCEEPELHHQPTMVRRRSVPRMAVR